MTGTSLDGIDVAVAAIEGTGLRMRAELLRHRATDLGPMRDELLDATRQRPMSAERFAGLAGSLGRRYEAAIAATVETTGPIALIAVHGQTVFHRPPLSWQLIDPSRIARRFGCPVVSDLRQADLAAGGGGAPITPLADWVLFRGEADAPPARAIVNLGGFCNVTVLKKESDEATPIESGQAPRRSNEGERPAGVRGFDVCACNQVLDAVARAVLGARFDEDGRAARSGRAVASAVDPLYRQLCSQRTPARSLGTGDEATGWVQGHCDSVTPADLAASAVAAVARCIGESIEAAAVDEIYVAGGGARNLALVEALAGQCRAPLARSEAIGVPVEARESLAMAVLGALCADGVAITLPSDTGCQDPAPVAGRWCLPGGLAGLGLHRAGSDGRRR